MTPEQLLITAIVTMAGVIVTLWRNDVSNRKREQVRWGEEVKELKKQLTEAISRIRHLEDRRADEATQYGHELKALCERLIKGQAQTDSVIRGVREAFDRMTSSMDDHKCMAGFQAHPLKPIPETDTIVRRNLEHA